jgi:uncharacterized protein (TIGR00369 family)
MSSPIPLADQVNTAIEKFIVGAPYGQLLGLECREITEDRVSVRLPFRPEITTLGEMVHGGAISALVDVAATGAAWATPKATLQAKGSTVGFSLSFLSPALGCDLVAEARVLKRGRSLCVIDVSVADSDGTDVARAMVTYRLSLSASG